MNKSNQKNVLLFSPSNKRSVVIETIANQINLAGHNLVVLTTSKSGDLHEQLDILRVKNYTKVYDKRFWVLNYLRYVLFLISFCKKNKINTLWSHLQECNFSAVLAQYFIRSRVITFRHHFHAIIKKEGLRAVNKNELLMGKVISKLAKEIVVPSTEVYQGMIKYEKVKASKISIIPYIYDFSMYGPPDLDKVAALKKKYLAKVIIIVASRMIKMKRHQLVLPVFKKVIKDGLDIKVLLMDDGEERANLEDYVNTNGLSEKIYFLGYQRNIIDYLFAADLLVHPSYTEASSSLVKEVGLAKKPVIVCKGVGDFDEYIIHGQNGFLVEPPNEAEQFEKYIKLLYEDPELGYRVGQELHKKVNDTFSANAETVKRYLDKL